MSYEGFVCLFIWNANRPGSLAVPTKSIHIHSIQTNYISMTENQNKASVNVGLNVSSISIVGGSEASTVTGSDDSAPSC